MFDLDPSTDDFEAVRATALRLRDALERLGLVPFVKTSGSKGLHVVAPLRPTETFDLVYALAERVALELIAQTPDLLTLAFLKADRGARILLDIRRNAYAQTAVAPYAVRARPGAPVAVPLSWDEVLPVDNTRTAGKPGARPARSLSRRGSATQRVQNHDMKEGGGLRPDGFAMAEALERAHGADPWAGFRKAARSGRKALDAARKRAS